ncbi:MAG: hypothetical protein AB8G11_00230 [Saprospiraceae bacterium]
MNNSSIRTDNTAFNIFLRSDEQQLHQIYQENRMMFVRFATIHFDCESNEAGDIFRQAFTILYLNIKNKIITSLTSSVEYYFLNIGESLLKNKYTTRKKREITEKFDIQMVDFGVIKKQQNRQTKVVLTKALHDLGEPCRSILKLSYFGGFSIENMAQQIGYNNIEIAKKKKYQCLGEFKKVIENQVDLKDALLNN